MAKKVTSFRLVEFKVVVLFELVVGPPLERLAGAAFHLRVQHQGRARRRDALGRVAGRRRRRRRPAPSLVLGALHLGLT